MQIFLPAVQCFYSLGFASRFPTAEPPLLLCKVCGRSNAGTTLHPPRPHPAAPASLFSFSSPAAAAAATQSHPAAAQPWPICCASSTTTARSSDRPVRSSTQHAQRTERQRACPPAAIARCPRCRLVHAHAHVVPTLAYLLCPFPPSSAAALQAAARSTQRPLLCKPPPGLVHAHMLGMCPCCPTCCALLPSPTRCRSQ